MKPEIAHALWRAFHLLPDQFPALPALEAQESAQRALAEFDAKVIVAGLSSTCQCGDHWTALRQSWPPHLASVDAFRLWTVEMHDRVNMALRKPAFLPYWLQRDRATPPDLPPPGPCCGQA